MYNYIKYKESHIVFATGHTEQCWTQLWRTQGLAAAENAQCPVSAYAKDILSKDSWPFTHTHTHTHTTNTVYLI